MPYKSGAACGTDESWGRDYGGDIAKRVGICANVCGVGNCSEFLIVDL